TYNLDRQVPDSAGTGTAYLTGVKANKGTVGVSGDVHYKDCDASLLPENRLDSILKWAQDAGMDTGLVTTTQVTHATPAALYAKSADRYWQCDTKMIQENVIMGGGRQELGATPLQEVKLECPRTDGRNLVEEWAADKEARGATHAYVTNTQQLLDLNPNTTDYLMGLFGERHTPYVVDRDPAPAGTPRLKEMVQTALRILKKSSQGFFLLVEGGMIDRSLHDTHARRAVEEVVELDETMQAALDMVDLEDTLVLVTADHSHTLTMAGYPPRGNDILGKCHLAFPGQASRRLNFVTLG
ncbi:Alkaline phosphatase, tissue-nonspecific isozyme-like 6, partial [Homarus americanus]